MLLAIDTSTSTTGIALFDGEKVLAECTWQGPGYQTVELAPEIGLLLRRVGRKTVNVKAVAVATGPGSFTGLRIGIALAKGLALSGGRDLIGVPTMDVIAQAQPKFDTRLYVVLEAGRGRLAGMWYKWGRVGWQSDGELDLVQQEELPDLIDEEASVCGELSKEVRKLLRKEGHVSQVSAASCHRRPGFLAELGWNRLRKGEGSDPKTLSPIYISTGSNGGV
jgi:tRNA threonylcarbamoyladenosine biosynthesis protein TsaB